MNKQYRVLIEYPDETLYTIYIVARSKEEATELIERRFKNSRAIEVEEVNQ